MFKASLLSLVARKLATGGLLRLQVIAQSALIQSQARALKEAQASALKLGDEVMSLRKGTMAGFHEAACASLDNVLEAARAELGALEHEPILDAAKRRTRDVAALKATLEVAAKDRAELQQRLGTIARVGGVEEAARRLIGFRPGETFFQACKRVSDELKAVTTERDSITSERDEARRELHGAKKTIAELSDRLEETVGELSRARAAVVEELRRRDELASSVGHGAG